MYPSIRLRRNRKSAWLRDLVAEISLESRDLVLPVFVTEGENVSYTVNNISGIEVCSADLLIKQAERALSLGIKAIAVFPVVAEELKSLSGEEAYNPDNLICKTVRLLKSRVPEIGVIVDVALDPYTSHGHDGLIVNGEVDNDSTLLSLCKQAIVLAESGADVLAPSDMMDGRVRVIREALDRSNFYKVSLLSYAVKYASNLYGPFRDIVGSKKLLGQSDKKTYQMDFRNYREAEREVRNDVLEGADMIMIKPAMWYLDIILKISKITDLPLFGYQTSGEYAMLKYAAHSGCFDYKSTILESLICIKRAGAKVIFTYSAIEVAQILQ